MKTSLRNIASAAALVGGLAFLQIQTGCTSSSTTKSAGEYVDDAAITTRVKAAFVRDPIVKALEVNVDTFKGTVQLSGFVDSAEEKAQAERVAAGVPGVQSVKNGIALRAMTGR